MMMSEDANENYKYVSHFGAAEKLARVMMIC